MKVKSERGIFSFNRLHREALKQSATDPMSGKIDVTILTTGLSSAARKRRVEVAQSLKKMIQAKGKVATLNFQKVFQELKDSSDLVRRKSVPLFKFIIRAICCGDIVIYFTFLFAIYTSCR